MRSFLQRPPDRFQEIVGGGRPVAEQFKDKSSPAILKIFWGGFVVKIAGDQTTNEVTAEASPNAFFALHT